MTVRIMSEEGTPKLYVRVEPMVHKTKGVDPSLDSVVMVNDDMHPVLISNEHFTGHLVFRVRNFHGWTPLDEKTGRPRQPIPDCPHYFEGHKRTFSLQLSGRFRRQWTGDDIMFGTFFRKRLTLPRGSGLALAFAKRIDPSMEYEADTDTPYICSPLLCAMNTVNIQPLLAPAPSLSRKTTSSASLSRRNTGSSATSATTNATSVGRSSTTTANGGSGSPSLRSSLYETAVRSQSDTHNAPLTLPEWTYGGKHEILQENLLAAWPSWTINGGPSASSTNNSSVTLENSSLVKAISKNKTGAAHRRQWFLDEKHRKRFIFHPDTVYSFDFASPYVDMNEITLKMGISIPVAKYLDGQPVRYECRTRDGKILFWSLELGLK